MTLKKYDYVVFGASGFTGQFVVEELARVLSTYSAVVSGENKFHHWAIAGRSLSKLREVLRVAKENTGINELEGVPIIIADVSKPDSLLEMAKQARVILNCVGPYRFYGEPVVKAAIDGGAHHVDISGEPSYLEGMQLKYDEAARNAGVYIIGCCGWDSIPSEMGIQFTQNQFDGTLNSIENVIEVHGGDKGIHIHFGTLHSLIYGLSNRSELKSTRKKIMDKLVPKSIHPLKRRGILFYHEDAQGWCVPFLGSDKPVAQRTQYFNYHTRGVKPVQVQHYYKFPSLVMALMTMIWAVYLGIMSQFRFTRNLLEKYPKFFTFGVFSHEGPTRDELKGVTFKTECFGRGWSGKKEMKVEEEPNDPPKDKIRCRVTGPDPGYVATSACLVASARAILEEKSILPPGGGVMTPGAAFAKTQHMFEHLANSGVKFEKVN